MRVLALFELRQIGFGYGHGPEVLRQVNLQIEEGDFIILRGPSGGGKSTLLHLLNRLLVPRSGEIYYQDRPLATYEPTQLRRQVLYLQQAPVLLEASVRDNLLLPFGFRSARGRQPTEEELQGYLQAFLLERVSLDANATCLSLGQQQRLAFIRALLLAPEVLLLDEPTASLDQESREVVEDWAEALNLERGVTVVMISHAAYSPRRVKPREFWLAEGQLRLGECRV